MSPLSAYKCRLILLLIFINFAHGDQIHFIKSDGSKHPKSPFHLDASLLGTLIAHALGIDVDYQSPDPTTDPTSALDHLVNDVFNPMRNYWMVIFVGMKDAGPKDPLESHIVVNLDTSKGAIDLQEALTVNVKQTKRHLMDLVAEKGDRRSLLLFDSNDYYLYDAISPVSLRKISNAGAFIGTRGELLRYLAVHDVPGIFTAKLYASSPTTTLSQRLENDLKEIPRLVDFVTTSPVVSSVHDDMVNASTFNLMLFASAALKRSNDSKYAGDVEYLTGTSGLTGSGPSTFYTDVIKNLLFKELKPEKQTLGMVLFLDSISVATQEAGMEGYVQSMSNFDSDIPYCYASEQSCVRLTGTCSGRGKCVDKSLPSGTILPSYVNSTACWVCECSEYGWTGSACQYEDWSDSFFVILASIVILVVFVIWSIWLLTSRIQTENDSREVSGFYMDGASSQSFDETGFKED